MEWTNWFIPYIIMTAIYLGSISAYIIVKIVKKVRRNVRRKYNE